VEPSNAAATASASQPLRTASRSTTARDRRACTPCSPRRTATRPPPRPARAIITMLSCCAGVRLHDLRHTCASLAISAGANVKVVQKLLGHMTATLTLDRYGHLFPDDLDAVADAFDSAAGSLRTLTALRPVAVAEKGL